MPSEEAIMRGLRQGKGNMTPRDCSLYTMESARTSGARTASRSSDLRRYLGCSRRKSEAPANDQKGRSENQVGADEPS
jgi:hypothetical protein